MPFKSKKQERYLQINEPEIYQDWVEKYGRFKAAESFSAESKPYYEVMVDSSRLDNLNADFDGLTMDLQDSLRGYVFSLDYGEGGDEPPMTPSEASSDYMNQVGITTYSYEPDWDEEKDDYTYGEDRPEWQGTINFPEGKSGEGGEFNARVFGFKDGESQTKAEEKIMSHVIDNVHVYVRERDGEDGMYYPVDGYYAESFGAKEHSWIELPKPKGYIRPKSLWRKNKHWKCEYCHEIKHTDKVKPNRKGCDLGKFPDDDWFAESFNAEKEKRSKYMDYIYDMFYTPDSDAYKLREVRYPKLEGQEHQIASQVGQAFNKDTRRPFDSVLHNNLRGLSMTSQPYYYHIPYKGKLFVFSYIVKGTGRLKQGYLTYYPPDSQFGEEQICGIETKHGDECYCYRKNYKAESFGAEECVSCDTPDGYWRGLPLCSSSGEELCISCCACNMCRSKWNMLELGEQKAESFSAEGDYEPSFDSLEERIEWMEFAVNDKFLHQYEDDYSNVVLDIEEWNESNGNNFKLSNLVKQYKNKTDWMDAESFKADDKLGWCEFCRYNHLKRKWSKQNLKDEGYGVHGDFIANYAVTLRGKKSLKPICKAHYDMYEGGAVDRLTESFGAEGYDSALVHLKSLMPINRDSYLRNFRPSELTHSSTNQINFNQASVNYSAENAESSKSEGDLINEIIEDVFEEFKIKSWSPYDELNNWYAAILESKPTYEGGWNGPTIMKRRYSCRYGGKGKCFEIPNAAISNRFYSGRQGWVGSHFSSIKYRSDNDYGLWSYFPTEDTKDTVKSYQEKLRKKYGLPIELFIGETRHDDEYSYEPSLIMGVSLGKSEKNAESWQGISEDDWFAESFNSYKVAPDLSSYTKAELVSSIAGPQGTAAYDEVVYDPLAQSRLSAESIDSFSPARLIVLGASIGVALGLYNTRRD